MNWPAYTVDGSTVKSVSPADFPSLAAGPIATEDPKLVEAKRDVRTKLINALGSYALEYPGGVNGFLDAIADLADEDETFDADLAAVVSSAYRIASFDAGSYGDADIWAEKSRKEAASLKESIQALARTAPYLLAQEPSPNVVPRARGRVSGHST